MAEATWAIIVARISNGAKSRLAGALDVLERHNLVLAMFSEVLTTSTRSPSIAGVVAVVDGAELRWRAESAGAVVVDDPGEMNAAVLAGVNATERRGATSVVVLPADVPLITTTDLEMLIAAAGNAQRAVVIGASRDGQGTNALLLRPPDVIAPAFGPPSVGRHFRAGNERRAQTRIVFDLGLALDVDTPADLTLYRESLLTQVSRGIA